MSRQPLPCTAVVVLLLSVGLAVVGAAPWWADAQSEPLPAQHPRIANGQPATAAELHACILLIRRNNIANGQAAMGSGSIVSRNRVLTAAHVITGATAVTVGFYSGRMQINRFRRANATYAQPMQSFDVVTFANDLAVLQFDTNVFPALNVIAIGSAAATGTTFVASYGFTGPNSLEPSQIPNVAEQRVGPCDGTLETTPEHFCATAQGTTVVCLGANGAGLYAGAGADRRLVGVASLVQPQCAGAGRVTAYARLTGDAVEGFLRSQGLARV